MAGPVVIPCRRCDRPHTPPLPVHCTACGVSFVRCASCKYDLADSPDGPCPECGVVFAHRVILDAIVIEAVAREETSNQRIHSIARFFGGLMSLAVLATSCAMSPLLAIIVAIVLLVVYLSIYWKLDTPQVVSLAMFLTALPAFLYGVALLFDGLSTLGRGSHYWTSFDVLTPSGFRPMTARRVVRCGGVLTGAAGVMLVIVAWRTRRDRRIRQVPRPPVAPAE